jgi:hypothetical protein
VLDKGEFGRCKSRFPDIQSDNMLDLCFLHNSFQQEGTEVSGNTGNRDVLDIVPFFFIRILFLLAQESSGF